MKWPDVKSSFLKTKDFQDIDFEVTFKSFEYKKNEDDPKEKKNAKTAKQKLKYVLPYSYPEWAIDPLTQEQRVDSNGEPFRNRYWIPEYPFGYTILYHFDEGDLETGSKPLFELFCKFKPKFGEKFIIRREGKDKETKWFMKRPPKELPTIQMGDGQEITSDELEPDDEIPF